MVMRQSPYGSGLARAAVDLALAMGAFEQDFDLLFMGAGVLQLLPQQDSARIGLRNTGRVLSSLPLYDVDTVFADGAALQRHGIEAQELILPATVLNDAELHGFLDAADHLVSC
jgi:tRNA 2-thiouridine synthesizing protein C